MPQYTLSHITSGQKKIKLHSLTITLHLKSRTGKSTEAEEVPRETVEFARSFELQMQGEILFWKIYSNAIYRAHECQKKSDTFLSLFTFCLLTFFSPVSLLHLSLSLFFSFISCALSLLLLSYRDKKSQNLFCRSSQKRAPVFPRVQAKVPQDHLY